MKGVAAIAVACCAALWGGAAGARAETCGVPDAHPYWVDYAGHDAPLPAKAGLVLAVSSGTEIPAQMRAAGASTIFFDLHLNDRVGTPTAPADPATIADKAKRLFDFAVSVTGCQTPVIAENELFGAQTPTPWSDTNAQYRANVLALLRGLAALGARPALTIANPPYTGGEAADWWRATAEVAILVRQVYFTSPNARGLYALGPVRASRAMRQGLRGLVRHLTEIGIPPSRIALELQFQSAPGLGARAGLQPRSRWLEVVKLEALAAKQVARETKVDSIWSWGWATFSTAGIDPDKPAAACVWLWARDPRLCDAPAVAGRGFDASLTEGQLALPPGARCVLDGGRIDRVPTGRLSLVTGDRGLAVSALLERIVLRVAVPDDPRRVLAAEHGIVLAQFGGSRERYLASLRRSHLTVADARSLIGDRLARDDVESRFKPPRPSQRAVDDFLRTYADQPARLVEADAPAPWLGDAVRGWAVATLAPPQLFTLPTRKQVTIDTIDGRFAVKALGPPLPLALLPVSRAEAAARAALVRLEKADVYARWLKARELAVLATAVCTGDALPTPGPVDVSPFVPFLG